MEEMRRKDRAVTQTAAVLQILDTCLVLYLAFKGDTHPYVIPINYGYTMENNQLTLYFHSAKEGKKLDLLAQNNHVSFALSCDHALATHNSPCGYSYRFSSIVGEGTAHILADAQEKIRAMALIMQQLSKKDFAFTPKMVEHVTLWCVRVQCFTAKQN